MTARVPTPHPNPARPYKDYEEFTSRPRIFVGAGAEWSKVGTLCGRPRGGGMEIFLGGGGGGGGGGKKKTENDSDGKFLVSLTHT